ncbi:hypothetical protein Tco_0526876 [Tanacetum coccineum]
MMVSIPMTFPSANSTEYLVSTVDRMMPLKELNSMKDDHVSMIKHFSRLEVEHFNLQLKYQDLKERFGNKNQDIFGWIRHLIQCLSSATNEQIQSRGNTIHELKEKISRLTMKNSDADPIFDPKALVSQNKDLTAKLNALHDLNERFRAENAKVKQHYKELPTQGKIGLCLYDVKTPKVFAFEKYAIDVELIPPRQRSNRNVHHGTCAKDFCPRDKQNASTNSLRKKRVTFVEPCETSTHNTPPQIAHQKINSTNAPGIPSTGVKGASAARRSKPRSNTKKDRTLPAKSALK